MRGRSSGSKEIIPPAAHAFSGLLRRGLLPFFVGFLWILFETLEDVTKESGEYRVSFERPYEGRLPPYHRLDVSVKRGFDFATSRLTLQLGLFNAYDRANLFYFDVWTLNRVDQMALVPSFGIKWETR